jgi:hypothetical protein
VNPDGSVTGSVTFNDYDNCDGSTLNGSASVTVPLTFDRLTVTASSLSITNGTSGVTTAGRVIVAGDFSGSSFTVTQDLWFEDDQGDVYRFENFVENITDGPSSTTVSMTSGRFYDPAFGYVDIRTDPADPMVIPSGGDPTGGTILVTGANEAMLDFSTYEVWVDTDGNTGNGYEDGPYAFTL